MNTFKVTKDGVFVDDLRIQACSEYNVNYSVDDEIPEVVLRFSCKKVEVEEEWI